MERGEQQKFNIFISYRRELANSLAISSATIGDYHELGNILRNAQQLDLEPDQIESKVRETPFVGLASLLPRDRTELYAFLALLLTIVQLIVSLRAPDTAPTITPGQVEEIIERVLEHHNEHHLPPAPLTPPIPPSHCK